MTDQTVERKLAAILVADVVGYSRLMGADEVGTLAALTRHRREFIDPTIFAHHGRIVKTTGDGFLLEFGSVVDATRCAIALQRGMAARNVDVPPTQRLVFRMGVDIGDIIVQAGDIFGNGVNVAARLEPLADPGGLAISRGAHEQIRDKLAYPFQDRGEISVKNIARPVSVFALGPEALVNLPDEPAENAAWAGLALAATTTQSVTAATTPAPAKSSSRKLIFAALGILALIGAAAAGWWLQRGSNPANQPFADALASILSRALPSAPQEELHKLVLAYQNGQLHRAMAVAASVNEHRWTADWPTSDDAQTEVLEKCQLTYGAPCAVIAVDDSIVAPDASGRWAERDMPRVRYAGLYNVQKIPGMRPKTLERSDVMTYASVAGPKAIAIHAQGMFVIVTGAATQHQAEEQALKTCDDDPDRRKGDRQCYLYASGNQVVLPLRKIQPMTPEP